MSDIKALLREAAAEIRASVEAEYGYGLEYPSYRLKYDAGMELPAQLEAAAESLVDDFYVRQEKAQRVAESGGALTGSRSAVLVAQQPAVQTGETSRSGRDCKHGHLARACEICDLEAKLAAAEEELAKHKTITQYYAETRRGDRRYSPARIAWELERTAMGSGYYGNALRVAKDLPEVTAEDRSLLDRYATGKQSGTDHVALQDLALRIDDAAIDAARGKGDV